MQNYKKMSTVLSKFIVEKYEPLHNFREEVIEILYGKGDHDIADSEILFRIKELMDGTNKIDEELKEKWTHWALNNIS